MLSEAIRDGDVKVKENEGSTQVCRVKMNLAIEQEEPIPAMPDTKSWSPEEPIRQPPTPQKSDICPSAHDANFD